MGRELEMVGKELGFGLRFKTCHSKSVIGPHHSLWKGVSTVQ